MSLHEYKQAVELHRSGADFYALIMAAVIGGDTFNVEKLRVAFPGHVDEVSRRWHAPGGLLPGESGYEEIQRAREAIGMPPA